MWFAIGNEKPNRLGKTNDRNLLDYCENEASELGKSKCLIFKQGRPGDKKRAKINTPGIPYKFFFSFPNKSLVHRLNGVFAYLKKYFSL